MTTAFDQLMLDLFTTALEGGIGYWSTCSAYHWATSTSEEPTKLIEDHAGFYAAIEDIESADPDDRWIINRKVMVNGWFQAIGPWRDKIRWSTEPPPLVVNDDTDWDFDAGDADCIVQLGLFGEVVYG